MENKIHYLLRSGKNNKLLYYIRAYCREYTPKCLTRMLLRRELARIDKRSDKDYILDRVNYYNKLTEQSPIDRQAWDKESVMLKDQKVTRQKVYYFDSMEIARYFPVDNRWLLLPGDITHVPELPTIVKSRPLNTSSPSGDNLPDGNANSVLLNMNKVRHFIFVNDPIAWRDKENRVVFRGKLGSRKPIRDEFMRRWYGHPMVDAGKTNNDGEHPEWYREKMTINEHLKYKFIMSIEGNDVASNLKWIMSSNCIAVTPRLTCETWFMEGRLIPNYHYIEVKSDFSDLEERLNYYISHPEEAEAIIKHAHEWVSQFHDRKREKLIAMMVMQKYFEITNKS